MSAKPETDRVQVEAEPKEVKKSKNKQSKLPEVPRTPKKAQSSPSKKKLIKSPSKESVTALKIPSIIAVTDVLVILFHIAIASCSREQIECRQGRS